MLLFGPKLNTVFASRWKALAWAASIMLSAYCSVPAVEKTKEKAEMPDASALGFGPAAEEQKQATSPWALETPAAKPATAFHRVGTGSAPE